MLVSGSTTAVAFGITGSTISALAFGLSATFHTLRSHSYNVHHFWGRMDIFGICILALGAGASATYYARYCDPRSQRIYWAVNSFAALAAAITLFDTGGGGNKMRAIRGGTFILLAMSAMLPLFQAAWFCCQPFDPASMHWYRSRLSPPAALIHQGCSSVTPAGGLGVTVLSTC